MNNTDISYSVVIPVYRAEKTLVELVSRLKKVLNEFTPEYEIIMVEDCGGDGSWTIMQKLHEEDHRIKIIQLMNNFGQHNAIMCGLHYAQGEYVITMDDDLQNPPEEIPKLISRIGEGYDIVYGEYISKRHNIFRNFGSLMIQFVYKKVFKLSHNPTAFRILKREIIQSILRYDKNYVFLDGLLAWCTKNIGYTPVVHEKRSEGRSGYSFKKLITLSLNMVTNFSIFPLQLATVLGLLFAALGFLMGLFFLYRKIFYGVPVEGYTSLIIAITVFSGIQLLTLGLIGEYLGRIHLNINAKPQYVIRDLEL